MDFSTEDGYLVNKGDTKSPKPKSGEKESKESYDALCERLEALESKLGLNKKKKTKDEILRSRSRHY